MTSEVLIRPYAESDLNAVIEILRDLFASELQIYDRTRPPRELDADYVAVLKEDAEKSRGLMLVAEINERVVGYCTLHIHRDTEGDTDEVYYKFSHIGDLGVLASHRSQGIGTKLIQHCENIVRAEGVKYMRLNVLAANARGRRFYAAQGFEENLINLEKAL